MLRLCRRAASPADDKTDYYLCGGYGGVGGWGGGGGGRDRGGCGGECGTARSMIA